MSSSEPGMAGMRAAHAVVDALVAGGSPWFVIAPGSRSAPLALAAARHPGARVQVVLDERAAAFFALGIAKASGRAAAVITTSGTATANLLPAVVEAAQSCVPLVLLTADRPPWLRGTGANQTIVQPGLYAGYVRLERDLPPPSDTDAAAWAGEARTALALATGRPGGPVHLNLCFDEPLISAGDAPSMDASAPDPPTPRPAPADIEPLAAALRGGRRGVVLAGTLERDAPAVAALADALGWPLLAEPTSGLRHGSALSAPQALLADDAFASVHAPEVVLQVGGAPTSRAALRLAATVADLLVLHEPGRPADPGRRAHVTVGRDVDEACAALIDGVSRTDGSWSRTWMLADAAARAALDAVLDAGDAPTELRLARDVAAAADAPLFVGSSLPVRDLDAAMRPRTGRVLGNRGASGIDGTCATVYGIAAVAGRAVGLIGDLALLHDASAFLWMAATSSATIVVPDNRGGGIFDLLSSASLAEHERLFRTPHAADLAGLARAAGASHARAERASDISVLLREAPALLEVPIDPEVSLRQRREVRAAAGEAIHAALAAG